MLIWLQWRKLDSGREARDRRPSLLGNLESAQVWRWGDTMNDYAMCNNYTHADSSTHARAGSCSLDERALSALVYPRRYHNEHLLKIFPTFKKILTKTIDIPHKSAVRVTIDNSD